MAREQGQLENIITDIRKEYQTEVQFLDWRRELWSAGDPLPERIRVEIEDDEDGAEGETVNTVRPPASEEDLQRLESTDWAPLLAERERLRDRLSSMGPVNLVAIEEYASLKERFTFLKTQSDDLWKAKNELLKAIDEINQVSVTLFKDTFEQVRKNFAFTFQTLFGGGTADLSLIDTGDVLESGIEITARPPGTKLRTLQLLSGGQRTMTAVGLLFAIYMVKPSPFCLLDELDAPLDDANVQRFTNMVRKFTEYSQFIVITHNKRTIAAADTIYGVTMEEKGVSKLVSMRFDKSKGDVKEVKEAAPVVAPKPAEPVEPAKLAEPVTQG
jgi:chromosome segregation protein